MSVCSPALRDVRSRGCQRLADFDTFSPGSAPPSQTHSLCNSPAVAPVPAPVIDDDDEPARLIVKSFELRESFAETLYKAAGATLDDLREAVTTLEDAKPIARRVLGGAHPTTKNIEEGLRIARAALRARETPGSA